MFEILSVGGFWVRFHCIKLCEMGIWIGIVAGTMIMKQMESILRSPKHVEALYLENLIVRHRHEFISGRDGQLRCVLVRNGS